MFRSKTRDTIVPQSEHAQMAGIIALLWGNKDFDRPDFNFDSFVMGVALHDFGHGFFDTNEIGAMDDELSYKVDSALVYTVLANPLANVVAHFHVLRLLKNYSIWKDLVQQCEDQLLKAIKLSGISREKYIWADRITEFCDFLSFDFCFDQESERICEVYAKRSATKTVSLKIKYDGNESVRIQPWPLKVQSYHGYITAYSSAGYPNNLQPVMRQYQLLPG